MRKYVLSTCVALMILLGINLASAAIVELKTLPITNEEKAVAKVVEAFVDAHGGSYATMAELLADDVTVCCFPRIVGVQEKYESKMRVAMFYTGRSATDKNVVGLVIRISGSEAEASGVYNYTIQIPGWRNPSYSYAMTWKMRKEDNTGYKIYEISVRGQ